MPFLSQGLRTEEAENTVVCLCEANSCCCDPFANYQPLRGRSDLHLILIRHT